jgi:hypothetical protein
MLILGFAGVGYRAIPGAVPPLLPERRPRQEALGRLANGPRKCAPDDEPSRALPLLSHARLIPPTYYTVQ